MEAGRAHGKEQGAAEGRKVLIARPTLPASVFHTHNQTLQCHKDVSPSNKAMSFMAIFVWSFILLFTAYSLTAICLKTFLGKVVKSLQSDLGWYFELQA